MSLAARISISLSTALVVVFGPPVRAQQPADSATVVPIQVNGDPAARFSLVVLAEGYRAAEMPRFRAHLDRHLNILWSIEPFRSYRNYFNVYSVEIVSAESGVTCDPEIRQQRNTPLRAQFGGGCTNPNARGLTVDQTIARQYAERATPHVDQILVIANSDTYGGIGGAVATSSGGNAISPLITPHELGHSLGRLQDEYTYSQRGVAGGPYTGSEPESPHMTLLAEAEMRSQQKKWWRWLGEVSASGGPIGRYEGGMQRTTGVWRPSRHSMMISLGYYFDQISLERMTGRISEQVGLIAASTPTDRPVAPDEVLWLETAHPVYHELGITWRVNGTVVASANNSRHLNINAMNLAAGTNTVTATVTDPTSFVRDPAIRDSALTATRSWTLGKTRAAARPADVAFTESTQTGRPVGGQDVVYVETAHPLGRVLNVIWRLDGQVVPNPVNSRAFALSDRKLTPGTHTLTATVTDRLAPSGPSQTRTWSVDNTDPAVVYTLSESVASLGTGSAGARHYLMRGEFTMKLDVSDDTPGYVVAEFRVNGDGWHHYYGWPDAPPDTPFKFTPRGSTIKELVYGSLSAEGLSPQPWEPRQAGWGTHRIEYRGIDAAGNIGAAESFRVTLVPSRDCTTVLSARHTGELGVSSGVTCLDGATVAGPVTVSAGASLFATNARIEGPVTASGAAAVELVGTTIDGALRITGTTDRVTVFGSTIGSDLALSDNRATKRVLVTGTTVRGLLTCEGNDTAPVNGGTPNTLPKGSRGQCSGMQEK